MKLLLLTQYFWPEGFSINELAVSLVDRGVDVEVLTGKPNYPDGLLFKGYRPLTFDSEDRLGIRIRRVPVVTRGLKKPFRLAMNYLSFVIAASVIGPWLLRKSKPDLVLVYAPSPLIQALPALWLGRLKRIPVVLYVQDLWPDSLEATGYVKSRILLWLVSRIVRGIYNQVDSILISSRPFEQPIRRLAPTARISYLPNSVDPLFADPDSSAKIERPELDDGFIVMFAGNVGAAQGVKIIVEAAEKLVAYPQVKFVVLGSGSELSWMQEQRKERELANLHLLGRFPVDAMPYMLSKASVLLITLTDRPIFNLTVPNKTQAYMAVGRPIVAALNGEGARIVTEAGAGIAVPAGDSKELAAAVVRLFKMDVEERAAMGQNGRNYYLENFHQEKVTLTLMQYLQQAVKKTS